VRGFEYDHTLGEKTMPETSILIVGPPSPLRDSYELSARRHETDVLICESCRSAHIWLGSVAVRAVIVLAGASDKQVDDFLASMRGEHPHVPVFFVGASNDESLTHRWLGHGTVILPPDLPTSQLEQVLFPAPPETAVAPDTGQTEDETILLARREYPLHFIRARALFETEFISRVLRREHGNVSRTAETIGMARRNLQIKIQAHHIDIARIRHES
jgi:DNA-binding NtrC family response regulator